MVPLPPPRHGGTGGSPASGSPVSGVTFERIDRSEPERCGESGSHRAKGSGLAYTPNCSGVQDGNPRLWKSPLYPQETP